MNLSDDDDEDNGDDDGQGELGSRLSKVVGGQTSNGDQGGKSVVVEGADESKSQIEDGLFDLGGDAGQKRDGAGAIQDEGDKGRGEKSFKELAQCFAEVGGVWWVGNEADVEEEDDKGAKEEDGRGDGEDGEEHESNGSDGKGGPSRIGGTLGLGRTQTLEGEGARESGREGCAFDSVCFGGLVVVVGADQADHATTASGICDDSGVDGGLTDEAVGTIDGQRIRFLRVGASDNQALVSEGLIADYALFIEHGGLAIGRTSKGEMGGGEGAALIAIETAATVLIPEIGTAPQILGSAIALDVARGGVLFDHERPGQEPSGIEGEQEDQSMFATGGHSVQQAERSLLDFGK